MAAEQFTAEWYEEKARRHKLKTWTPSERFPVLGKGGKADLILSSKLAPIKDLLKQYETDPVKKYSLSAGDKQTISTLKKYAPSLFAEAEPIVKPKTTTEKALQSAQKTEAQAKLYDVGGATPMETYLKTGYFPETTLLGKFQAGQKTAGSRMLGLLMAFPRGQAALANEIIAKAKSEITPEMKQGTTLDRLLAVTKLTAKQMPAVVKGTFTTAIPAMAQIGNEKYIDWSWAQTYKEQLGKEYPGFVKNWEWTKNQDDWIRGTNWAQKVGAVIAGSPADLLGLVTDILGDPLTYITGGIGKAAKVGTIAKSITTKGGKVILKKGSTLALTKAGSRLVAESLPDVIPIVSKKFAKELATFVGEGAQQSAKRFIVKKAAEYVIENAAKTLPVAETAKLIEYGGLKILGQTIIPGEKFAQTFGKAFTGENLPKVLKTLNKFLNPFAQVPDEIRPILSAQQSMARSRFNKFLFDTGDVVRPLSKAEKNTLADLMAIERDLIKPGTKPAAIKKLNEIMSKLDITPKVSEAQNKIHNMLDTEYAFIQSKIGDKVKYMEQYYPARYEKAPLPFLTKTAELGKEVAPFELKQQITYLQALEAGLKPKSVFETLSQYGFESAQRTARADFLNEVKQFGMMTDEVTKGYVKARDVADKIIPELKGWQFPDEIAKTFKRTYTTFFGDDATKAIINVYDRALTVWKRIALATPGYHLRNFYSDTFSGLMEYGLEFLSPRHWIDAVKIWTGKTVTRKGVKYTREIFAEYGVRAGQYMLEAALTGAAPARMIGKISPLEWSARFGAGRENLGRTVGALISLEHGNNIIDAAWTVKKVFFDYASLTAAEKNIMARIFPFYRWMRKNLERQFELILTRTGKYATIPKMMNYVENVAATRYGQDYMDEYGKFKPEYYERLGAMVTGATNVQGQPLVFNPNLPFQDLLSFGIKDLINKVTPLLKMGIEIPGKREIFTGAYLDFDKMKPAPQWLEVLVGKLPESLLVQMGMEKKNGELQMSGATEYVLKQVPTLYNLSRAMPAEETAKTPLDLLSMLGGIKFFNLDLEKQKEYKYKQFTTSMGKLLKRKVPEEELVPPDDMVRAYRQIYSDYVIANIMQTKNYDINEIARFKDMTKYTGSTKEIDLFIDLMQKPYKDEMAKIKGKTLPELARMLTDLGISPTAEEVNAILQQIRAQQ